MAREEREGVLLRGAGSGSDVPRLLCQQWSVVRTGDGSRPDGCSLHLSEEDRAAYVQRHRDAMKIECPGATEYEAPNGDPYWVMVNSSVFKATASSQLPGRRYYRHVPHPPPEAKGCWIPT